MVKTAPQERETRQQKGSADRPGTATAARLACRQCRLVVSIPQLVQGYAHTMDCLGRGTATVRLQMQQHGVDMRDVARNGGGRIAGPAGNSWSSNFVPGVFSSSAIISASLCTGQMTILVPISTAADDPSS